MFPWNHTTPNFLRRAQFQIFYTIIRQRVRHHVPSFYWGNGLMELVGFPGMGRTTLLGPGQIGGIRNATILCSSWPSPLMMSMEFLAWLYTGRGKSGHFLKCPPTHSILLCIHPIFHIKVYMPRTVLDMGATEGQGVPAVGNHIF